MEPNTKLPMMTFVMHVLVLSVLHKGMMTNLQWF